MRSFYSHLEAIQSVGEEVSTLRKPIFRSSAIFPVLHNANCSSRILFMGYWLLKRHIKEIGLLYTLRSQKGQILSRRYILVDSAKAFSISMSEFSDCFETSFEGSIELEIYSTQDLIFPYPAFVLVYYGDKYSTVVHTTGRIYNDIEDLSSNEEYVVRESGFDIRGEENGSPFIAFTNGPIENSNPEISFQIDDSNGKKTKGTFQVPALRPFETMFLHFKDYIDISKLLPNQAGSIKLSHNFKGFFPRFVAGNWDKDSESVSITHSYYDCSEISDEKAYWNRKDEKLNDSSVAIPLYLEDGYYTQLVVYPIFSPSDFTLSFTFYDKNGLKIKQLDDYHLITSKSNLFETIDFAQILKNEAVSTTPDLVNVICNWGNKNQIPTRVKFGLNVGNNEGTTILPSNICFAPQLGNPKVLEKKGTFRWAPLVNMGSSEVVLTNSSFIKEYNRSANVQLSFHREEDGSIIERKATIPANGILRIAVQNDLELNGFFNGQSGWMAAVCDNPFVNGYYFDFFESGAVAADHVF